MGILRQKAVRLVQEQYEVDLEGRDGEDIIAELERTWHSMTEENSEVGKGLGVDLQFDSGPLNELIVIGATQFKCPTGCESPTSQRSTAST